MMTECSTFPYGANSSSNSFLMSRFVIINDTREREGKSILIEVRWQAKDI